MTDGSWQGVPCRVVRYRILNDTVRLAIWLDPARGYHPLRMESAEGGETDATSFRRVLTVEPQLVQREYWYPRRVVYEQLAGLELLWSETLEVSDVVINQPIDPAVFQFKGMGLRENTHIAIRDTKHESKVWRRGELISYDEAQKEWSEKRNAAGLPPVVPQAVRVDVPAAGAGRGWWYAAAGGLAVVGAGLVWWAVRRRG